MTHKCTQEMCDQPPLVCCNDSTFPPMQVTIKLKTNYTHSEFIADNSLTNYSMNS